MYEAAVGYGACAAVLVPLAGDDKYSGSKAVGKNVAALTCELEGILLGLELAVRYFESSQYRKHTENLYILCDCSSAIDIIVHRLCTATCLELFTRLAHFEGVLSDMNVNIVLSWIPGHQEISCLLYTSPSPRDGLLSRMPSSA